MIDLERIAMVRAEEQIVGGAWRTPEKQESVFVYVAKCGACGRGITAKNRSGVCRDCYHAMGPGEKRESYRIAPRETARASGCCVGPQCSRPVVAHGLCYTHYRQQRAGKPLKKIRRHRRGILRPMTEAA